MPSATDPLNRFRRQQALQAGACWLAVLLVAAWAWRMPSAVAPAIATAASGGRPDPARPAPPPLDPALWHVTLWRPFTDVQPAAAQASATAPRLYSILQQDGGLTAAIAPTPDAALVYLKAGESGGGVTVVRVEADGVVLLLNGQEQRLGLGP